MANDKKLTQLTELTSVTDSDYLYVVDSSDTSGGTAGTSKKVKPQNALTYAQTSAESTAGVTPTNYQYEPGNVLRYGAAGDGATNDTTAIANAIASSDRVFFPAGTYITNPVNVSSDHVIYGVGDDSIIKQNSGYTTTQCVFNMTQSSSDTSLNIKNVVFRDLVFTGRNQEDGFSEFKHLFLCQGITNITWERCQFTAFQGDAIVIRSGNAGTEAKNLNCTIQNCIFDGIDKENRNAISITDCDQLLIDNNWFKNCTKSTMPGAIDVEPNSTYTFVVLDHITITNNRLDNIGGNVAAIGVFLPVASGSFTQLPKNFTIANNKIRDCYSGIRFAQTQTADVTDATEPMNIRIYNNSVINSTDRAFWIYGIRDCIMRDNYFEDSANVSRIGWTASYRACNEVKLLDNTFYHCGTTDGLAVAIYGNSERVDLIGNVFDNVGVTGGSFGVPITFVGGTVAQIRVMRNRVINNEGLTTAAITSTSTHTSGDNIETGNEWAGLDPTPMEADLTDYGDPTVTTGITAYAGGGQANAVEITTSVGEISTCVSTNDSVKLPTARGQGKTVTIINNGAATAAVFPSSGDNLGQGINTSEALTSGSIVTYKDYSTVNWVKIGN